VRLEECRELLRSFFAAQRAAKKNGENSVAENDDSR